MAGDSTRRRFLEVMSQAGLIAAAGCSRSPEEKPRETAEARPFKKCGCTEPRNNPKPHNLTFKEVEIQPGKKECTISDKELKHVCKHDSIVWYAKDCDVTLCFPEQTRTIFETDPGAVVYIPLKNQHSGKVVQGCGSYPYYHEIGKKEKCTPDTSSASIMIEDDSEGLVREPQ